MKRIIIPEGFKDFFKNLFDKNRSREEYEDQHAKNNPPLAPKNHSNIKFQTEIYPNKTNTGQEYYSFALVFEYGMTDRFGFPANGWDRSTCSKISKLVGQYMIDRHITHTNPPVFVIDYYFGMGERNEEKKYENKRIATSMIYKYISVLESRM